jgi:hypothetical protein
MSVLISVSEASKHLGVSERRVRFLLLAGRLKGAKDAVGHWQVEVPFTVQMGRRGPALFSKPAKDNAGTVRG